MYTLKEQWLFGFLIGLLANSALGRTAHGSTPYLFRENKGQVKDQYWRPRPEVLYSGESGGLVFHLQKDGMLLQLHRPKTPKIVSQSDY